MHRTLVLALVGAIWLTAGAAGCSDDSSGGEDGGTPDSAAINDTGVESDSGVADTGGAADSAVVADTSVVADTGGAVDSGGVPDAAGSTGDGPSTCLLCAQANCGPELGACQADTACWCAFTCIEGGGAEGSCKKSCSVGGGNAAWGPMILCLDTTCAGSC